MFGAVQAVLQDRVVQVPEGQRPAEPGRAAGVHGEGVAQQGAVRADRVDGEFVEAVEAAWSAEGEAHPLARDVGRHGVTDRAVAAGRARCQRAVEQHGRPVATRPEPVGVAGQAVEQQAHLGPRRRKHPLVHVVDAHRAPFRTWSAPLPGRF